MKKNIIIDFVISEGDKKINGYANSFAYLSSIALSNNFIEQTKKAIRIILLTSDNFRILQNGSLDIVEIPFEINRFLQLSEIMKLKKLCTHVKQAFFLLHTKYKYDISNEIFILNLLEKNNFVLQKTISLSPNKKGTFTVGLFLNFKISDFSFYLVVYNTEGKEVYKNWLFDSYADFRMESFLGKFSWKGNQQFIFTTNSKIKIEAIFNEQQISIKTNKAKAFQRYIPQTKWKAFCVNPSLTFEG